MRALDLTTPWITVVGVVIGVACALWHMVIPGFIDFQGYWFIGQNHFAQAYDQAFWASPEAKPWSPGPIPFPYPPPSFFLIRAMGLLPWRIAFCVWSGLQMGLFAFLASRMLGVFAMLPVLSLPALYSASIGQCGLFLTDLVLAAFMVMPGRPALGGALLAVAGCIKPQSLLAAPLVVWRNRPAIVAGVAVTLALCLLSLVFGPSLWIRWFEALPLFRKLLVLKSPLPPGLLFPFVGWQIALAAVGIAYAMWERGLRGFVVGTLLASPYFQFYDIAAVGVIGAGYIRAWWRSGNRRDAPMAAIGLFAIVCPMPALTLLGFCMAVIVSSLSSRRPFPAVGGMLADKLTPPGRDG